MNDDVPYIDERIRHMGVSFLRRLNGQKLRSMKDLVVIQDCNVPLAVVVPYKQFLELQRTIKQQSQGDK